MQDTRKWRRLALLTSITAAAAALTVAACSDRQSAGPLDPKPAIKGHMDANFYSADGGAPGPISYNGFPSAPSAPGPQKDAYDACFGALAGTSPIYNDQYQALVWDTTSSRAGGDTLFKARLRIKYRVYNGLYRWASTEPYKTIRCIKLDSVYTYRWTPTDTIWGTHILQDYSQDKVSLLVNNPSFESGMYSGADVWCWGNNLSANPHGPSCDPWYAASVQVRAKFPWARRCNLTMDGSDGNAFNVPNARTDTFQVGGLTGPNYTTWTGTPLTWTQQNGYTADVNVWEVQMYAMGPAGTNGAGVPGWWSGNVYGGQYSPYDNGWRSTSSPPVGQDGYKLLCSRYAPSGAWPDSYTENKWRGGRAHYTAPVPPTAWP